MFDFNLYYLEFDPIIGPKIERSCSTNDNTNHESLNDIRKSNSLNKSFQKYTNFIKSESINLQKKYCNIEKDEMSKIICNNAFPESFQQLSPSEPHFFTFTFNQNEFTQYLSDNFFCYSIYMSIHDENIKRNFHQFTYVIVTKLNSPEIFKKLLLSIFNSFRYSSQNRNDSFEKRISLCTSEIFDVLFSFLLQWQKIISTSLNNQIQSKCNDEGEKFCLPLLDGYIKIKIQKINSKKYEINEIQNLNSTSLFDSLNLDKIKILDQNGYKSNYSNGSLYNETIKLIWECLLLNKKILVIGSTPCEASDAVFAISSLVKNIKSFIVPYISVTDERFMQLLKNNHDKYYFPIIVGVSNPISEFLIRDNKSFFDFIYYVGFDDKVGFKELMSNANLSKFLYKSTQGIKFSDNQLIMKKIDSFSTNFLNSFDQFFIEMSKNDFLSLFFGKINVTLLSKELYNNKIQISQYMKDHLTKYVQPTQPNSNIYSILAKQAINSQLFAKERKKFICFSEISQNNLIDDKFINNVINFENEKELEGTFYHENKTSKSQKSKQITKNILSIYFHALINSVDDEIKKKLRRILKDMANYL